MSVTVAVRCLLEIEAETKLVSYLQNEAEFT